MQPYDYSLKATRPGEAITQGLITGAKLGAMETQQEQQRIALEQAQAKQQQAIAMQQEFTDLSQKPNPTYEDYTALATKYPAMSENLTKTWAVLNEGQRKNITDQAINLYSAINAGQTDIAKTMLQERAEAARNSNKPLEERQATAMLELVEKDPEAAKTSAGLLLANTMGKDKFTDVFTKLQSESRTAALQPIKVKQEKQQLEKVAEDIGLTNAQKNKVLAETRKLNLEMRKSALELEALQKSGGIPTEKKFDQEEKLRKEYTSRTQNYTASVDAFTKINESAKDVSGAGDIALITSFMKMLDPGSVVRETEFATAQDTAGLYAKLQNAAEKVQTGMFLTPKQREEFTRLAGRYMKAAEGQESTVRASLNKVVKNYGLNPENVFNAPAEQATGEPPSQQAKQFKPPVAQQPITITVDY